MLWVCEMWADWADVLLLGQTRCRCGWQTSTYLVRLGAGDVAGRDAW